MPTLLRSFPRLALLLALSACDESSKKPRHDPTPPEGTSDERERALALAGDGSRAYHKLAAAWCERAIPCRESSGYGNPWSSPSACEDYTTSELAARLSVDCRSENDHRAEPDALATCIEELWKRPCNADRELRELAALTRRGLLPGCRAAAEQLARAEDERIGAKAEGEPCLWHEDCPWDGFCTATEESCGECRPLPRVGERCLVLDDSEDYCGLGLLCVNTKCVVAWPEVFEPCMSDGYCDPGADCDSDGKCAELFEEGDACDQASAESCGRWLTCMDGQCLARGPLPGQLGSACAGPRFCSGGRCIEGTCEPLAKLGEPCNEACEDCKDDECERPYACVKGTCTEVPACGGGDEGDVCTGSDQCKKTLGCIHNSDAPNVCEPIPGELGEPCDVEGCHEGQCTDGVCVLADNGHACTRDLDCRSAFCADGLCDDRITCD